MRKTTMTTTRKCLDCPRILEGKHGNRLRCPACATRHAAAQRRAWDEKERAPVGPARRRGLCVDCKRPIAARDNRNGNAQRCRKHRLENRRKYNTEYQRATRAVSRMGVES